MPEMGARSLVEEAYQALDNHLRQWSWMGEAGHESVTRSFLGTYGTGKRFDPNDPEVIEEWMQREHDVWDKGSTVVLDPEVHRTLMEAAETMPDMTFDPEMIPGDGGIITLPGNAMLVDYVAGHDRDAGIETLPIAAIGWQRREGIGVAVYTGEENEDGVPLRTFEPRVGVELWLYISTEWARRELRQGGKSDELGNWGTQPYIIVDMTPFATGIEWRGTSDYRKASYRGTWMFDGSGDMLVDPHVAVLRRFMMALFVFMRDEIVVMPQQRPHRALRRRLERIRPDIHDGMLRICQLRKKRYVRPELTGEENDEEKAKIEWSHRWWVRPHWRKLASGKTTYVTAYIKGPEHLPLVLKNDITAVRR